MTKEQLEQGYRKEIEYQRHMLENLSRWMNLWFMLVGIGVVLFFLVCGIVAVSVGILGMLVFGCGIYHGNKNLRLVIEDFKEKVSKTE